MKPFLHNHKLKLTTISPVHIGDGEMYEPTNYFIDDGELYYFDDTTLISQLNQTQLNDLMKIVSQPDSYQQLQLFYKREDIREVAKNITLYRVKVSKDIEKNYNTSLGKVKQREAKGNDVFNSLTINTTIKTSNLPYIPGSSFKGSLKTAFFSHEAKDKRFEDVAKKDERYDRRKDKKVFKGYNFEKKYFGEFEKDPFSKIKISDFVAKEPKLQINWAVNKKKKSDTTDNDNTGVRFEFIAPESIYVTELTIMDLINPNELKKINEHIRDRRKQLHQPSKSYLKDEIMKISNEFFISKYEEEVSWAKNKKHIISTDYLKRTSIYVEKAKKGEGFLIRVGRHSGAVSMTLDNHRKVHIPQMKKDKDGNDISEEQKYVKEPFTYWLSSNQDSVVSAEFIGWVFCEFIDDELYNSILKSSQTLVEKQKKQLLEEKKRVEEAQEKLLKQKREQEEKARVEELAKKEEEAKEKAKLEAMSPFEKYIYDLKNLNMPLETALFNSIKNGEIDESFKCEGINYLKNYLKEQKKWKEATKAKKPEKDKDYQRTLKVLEFIKKCS